MMEFDDLTTPAGDAFFGPGRKWLAGRLLLGEPRIRHAVSTRRMMESPSERGVLVRRLQRALEWGEEPICLAEQVHGAEVAVIRPEVIKALGRDEMREFPGVDALVANCSGVTLAVFTADCVPALLADAAAGVIGAVHAGWRGTLEHVLSRALDAAFSLGARPERTKLWIGPAISGRAYEVSPDLAERFTREFPACAKTAVRGRLVDLPEINRHEAVARGLSQSNVSLSNLCTRAWPGDLCSYRADGENAGRMATAISLRGGSS